MKRDYSGFHRASRKKLRKRMLAMEALEPKRVLDATFGFVPTGLGFAFQVTGTDFNFNADNTPNERADNFVIWDTDDIGGIFATNWYLEYVNTGGTWKTLQGSITADTVADEATDRGLQPGDFEGIWFKAEGGNDRVTADGTGQINRYEPDSTPGEGDPVNLTFGSYNFNVDGNGGNDTINGSLGDDVIRGGSGNDVIYGNAGDDTVQGGEGDDRVYGGSGQDNLDGQGGRDHIDGGAGDDTIKGGDGDDGRFDFEYKNDKGAGYGLIGGPGTDWIQGEAGADDLVGDIAGACTVGTGEGEFNPNDIGSDILEGGDGDDSMLGDGKDKTPKGGTGTDTWQAGCTMTQGVDWDGDNVDIEQIYTDGTQTLEPTKRANDYQPRHVSGDGDTASTIKFRVIERGRGGPFPATGPHVYNDIVDSRGWVDDDVDGVEVMTGGGNDQVIGSDTGKDIIFGGNGNDKLAGLGQQDFLSAGEGDDTISGGAAGDDIFGGDEDPTVTDTDVDGEDLLTYGPVSVTDRLDVPGSSEAVTVSLEGRLDWYLWNSDKNENPPDGGADFGRGGDAQGDIIRDKDGKNTNGNKSRDGGASDSSIEDLTGSESGDWLAADQTDNVVKGGGGDDMLFGLGADDEIRGGDGKDDIYGDRNPRQVKGWPSGATGAAGNDELWGDKGDDNIHGDDGQDKLLGGDGDDSLVGGLGEDGTTGGKGDDVMKLEFEDEAANYDITDFNGFYGAFGDEGMDTFQIDFVPDSLDNAENRLNARVELALADIDGITDFDVNQDQVAFA